MDKAKKQGTGTNLDKLREQFNASKGSGSGGSYNWFRPQWQDNIVRILPAIDPEDVFSVPTARHRVDGEFYYCLKYDADPESGHGKSCPLCNARTRLFRSGDPDLIKIAREIKAKKQFLMHLIDRKDVEDPTKVYVYAAGVKIYNKIVSTMIDDEIDITDIAEGFDFVVKKEEGPKTEFGQFPSYDNSKAKRKNSPLSDDPDTTKKILENRSDLKQIPRFEEAEVLQAAIDNYIQSLTSGGKEEFYSGSEKSESSSAAGAPSEKAKSRIDSFKEKLKAQLNAGGGDADDGDDE